MRAAGGPQSAAPAPVEQIDRTRDVLLDTGVLVALQSPKDRHPRATTSKL
jgi:hypothetical protein